MKIEGSKGMLYCPVLNNFQNEKVIFIFKRLFKKRAK